MHGGQRHATHDLRRDAARQALQARAAALQVQVPNEVLVAHPLLQGAQVLCELGMRCRVDHAVDVGLHRRLLDAVQVVAHAHVEAEGVGFAWQTRVEDFLQQVQREPGLQILVEGLGQRVLGRPLGVVALVLGIDAWLGDFQAVHDLHGLQLDEAPPRQPGTHGVLRQLRMRASRRPERRLAGLAEDPDQAVVGLAIELAFSDLEDRTAGLVLTKDARQQSFERDRTHDVAHGALLAGSKGIVRYALARRRARAARSVHPVSLAGGLVGLMGVPSASKPGPLRATRRL